MKRFILLAAVAMAALVLTPLSSYAAGSRTKPAKPERIAQGREVQITDYLVPGKTTIFDFTSEYCPPCRTISPRLDELHTRRDDIVIVKVDLNRPGIKGIDWQSPVAKQYHVHSIPHFKVFGPDGKLIAEGDKARALVTGWLK
jgi:thiol-disulfide isomerase/thioredoxin